MRIGFSSDTHQSPRHLRTSLGSSKLSSKYTPQHEQSQHGQLLKIESAVALYVLHQDCLHTTPQSLTNAKPTSTTARTGLIIDRLEANSAMFVLRNNSSSNCHRTVERVGSTALSPPWHFPDPRHYTSKAYESRLWLENEPFVASTVSISIPRKWIGEALPRSGQIKNPITARSRTDQVATNCETWRRP